ncbi:MAG: IPTL-CTERM sorting domain-containing protein [Betaproteobacteria bacterium]|nr:IPTL-CTERM sorting domain-containing protein [Betaproteobacteria bacterium]
MASFRTLAQPKAAPGSVPTLNGIALTLLALLLAGGAAVAVRRQRAR